MPSFTYDTDAPRTASDAFHNDLVGRASLRAAIDGAARVLSGLDNYKRALFYGDETRVTPPTLLRRAAELAPEEADLLHAALGLATEAGELLEAVLPLADGGPVELDRTNLIEEFGDAEWYLALGRRAVGVTQAEVQTANLAKLRARFPDRFDADRAKVRDLAAERRALAS